MTQRSKQWPYLNLEMKLMISLKIPMASLHILLILTFVLGYKWVQSQKDNIEAYSKIQVLPPPLCLAAADQEEVRMWPDSDFKEPMWLSKINTFSNNKL